MRDGFERMKVPTLDSLVADVEGLCAEYGFAVPENIETSDLNRYAVNSVAPEDVYGHLEHHIAQFKAAVAAQPERLDEIVAGSPMFWLFLNRAKEVMAMKDVPN